MNWLTTTSDLELYNIEAESVMYRGLTSVRLVEAKEQLMNTHSLAVIRGSSFRNGTIEAEVAGAPVKGAIEGARGFVGIAFRVQPQATQFECFYLRPTNGRANDQLRRNHATQYISYPDYPWHKLREESPGVYESYTDLVVSEWTPIKLVVSETQAQLYVNLAEQPCLIVNDLKLGNTQGQIAFWIGTGTEAHFSNLVVNGTD